ncbi:MAG: restriction endonuclease subunit S [Burkholderiales bacterium]|nr:restriction endonuclease subunit S [Burkholderiales bacterium]
MATLRSFTRPTATWNPATEPRDTIRYVDVSAVSRETLAIESVGATLAKDAPSRARKIVQAGDTIFATIRPALKRVAKVPPDLNGEIVSTAFCVLRPDRERLDSDYLFFLASSDGFVASVAEHETGASYPAVRDRDVLDQEIELPPLDEQRDISTALNALRRGALNELALLNTAQELKQAAMRELFTRGLRGEAQKETEIGLVPESWKPRTIVELCEIWSGGTPRKSVAEYWNGGIPWVSGKDLKLPALDDAIDHISAEGVEAASRLAPQGTVLLLVRGMGLAKDLPVAVINRPMAFNQDVKALVSRGEYSGQFLRSAIYAGKERLLSQIVPSAHGTMTLNLNDVENFKVACPTDPDEATEIVAILDALDRKIDLHRRKRAVLEELFQSLLHKLMTGELRVADLDLSALGSTPSLMNPGAAEPKGDFLAHTEGAAP